MTALMNQLAGQGVGAGEIGKFAAIAGIPWALQFLWAPLVDRFGSFAVGRRRFWTLLASVGCNLSLLSLLTVADPRVAVTPIAWMLFVNALFASLLNVAVDAQLIDVTPEEEKSLTSAISRGGMTLSTSVSAAFFAWLLPLAGFRTSVCVLIALSIVMCAFAFWPREKPCDRLVALGRKPRLVGVAASHSLFGFAKSALLACMNLRCLSWITLSMATGFAFSSFHVLFATELLGRGSWTSVELSHTQAALGFLSGTLGTVMMGYFFGKIGSRRAVAGCLLASLALFAWMGAQTDLAFSRELSWLPTSFMTIAPGAMFIAVLPGLMTLTKKEVAATQFAIFMALMNAGELLGSASAGKLVRDMGFTSVSWLLAAAMGICLVALYFFGQVPETAEVAATEEAPIGAEVSSVG